MTLRETRQAAAVALCGALSMGPLVLLLLWVPALPGPDAQPARIDQIGQLLGPAAGAGVRRVVASAGPTSSASSGSGSTSRPMPALLVVGDPTGSPPPRALASNPSDAPGHPVDGERDPHGPVAP